MEKLFIYIDFSILNCFFSFDVPVTEQNQIWIITRIDHTQLDLAFEETVNNFTRYFWDDIEHRHSCRYPHGGYHWYPDSGNQFWKWTSFWPMFVKRNPFITIFIGWLWYPLFFSITIMAFYVHDLFKNIYFGYRFNIERKTKTFFYWNYNNLRKYYWIIFLVYPRWNRSFFLKLPNPMYIFHTLSGYFHEAKWTVKYSWCIFFYFFVIYYFTDYYVRFHGYWVIGVLIAWYICVKVSPIFKTPIGLQIKLYLLERRKKSSGLWRFFSQRIFFVNRYTTFPIFVALTQFIFVNLYIVQLYIDLFYKWIMIWDGYFFNTLTEVYFVADTVYNIANWASNNHTIYFDYWIGLDGINVWMIWLTCLLVILCILFLWENQKNDLFFSQIGWIFLLLFASIQFFCVTSYFWMYIFFELSLLPIFVLVVYWGSNRRKIHAAYQMVLFTFIGSIFLLGSILLLYFKLQTFNLFDIIDSINNWDSASYFSLFERKIVWLFMFAGFAVKTPLYPFHIWLPEAHSEAPTAGSVLLAGVLLKMGTYGFMWFVMPTFPDLIDFYKTLLFSMCICGVVLSSLSALAQIDIKKIIAYSSIGHMGLVILGLCTFNQPGLTGGCFMMLSHGLISSALFFCIGLLYKIYGTRSVLHYNAIAHFMPKFAMCFYVFILANMGFPGTAGFPAEVLIFSAVVGENFFVTLLMGLGSIIGGTYSIWLLTRVLYGQINSNITLYWDLKPIEWKVVGTLAILVIIFGVFSYLILDFFKPYCSFFEIKCIFPQINI